MLLSCVGLITGLHMVTTPSCDFASTEEMTVVSTLLLCKDTKIVSYL